MEAVWRELAQLGGFVLRNFWRVLPFLAVTVPLAVVFRHTGISDKIRTVIGKGPLLAVTIASAVGALSPFCSCGVIPVVAGLLASGVPLAPVMSFWLASPSMDPEILFLSAGIVGWDLALWRLGATLVMSFGAGLLTMLLERSAFLAEGILRESTATTPGAGIRMQAAGQSLGAAKTSLFSRIDLRFVAKESGQTLLKFTLLMAVAFVLEALTVRFVPASFVAGLLGAKSAFAVPLATLVGIPLYTTNLSALGIISGLLRQGMDGGAALAFLIGGAVTTIPAMSAVYGVVKPRVFALYLTFAVAGSLFSGYAFKLVHLFL
jgi:uncharacterized membrane protein YraQ (UPF0718 family)